MDFISFASWTQSNYYSSKVHHYLYDNSMTHISTRVTEFGIKTRPTAMLKIELCYWLLILSNMQYVSSRQKPTRTSGLRPCDRNCSKFFPAPFWSHNHNQKGAKLSLLYLPAKLMLRPYVLT